VSVYGRSTRISEQGDGEHVVAVVVAVVLPADSNRDVEDVDFRGEPTTRETGRLVGAKPPAAAVIVAS
jgi:hypothetical protein